ncbi:MAG TPA: hypothetical protein PL089_15005 [Ignavibacteria bacterium]|nr:hypothetical protein [Ignavibacteria bacterium]
MTYKTAIDLFLTKYRIEILKRKEKYPALNNSEIMVLLSEVQAELGNRYRLLVKNAELELTSGVYRYTVGSDASKTPKDLLAFKEIHKLITISESGGSSSSTSGGYGTNYGLDYGEGGETVIVSTSGGFGTDYGNNYGGGGTVISGGNGSGGINDSSYLHQLEMISREDMSRITKIQGEPKRYTVFGMDNDKVLEIDTIPGEGLALEYLYYARFEMFDENAGTSNSLSFSDYNTSLSGFGGSWKIPLQWQNLIVEGAIAGIFPEKMNLYLSKINNLHNRRPEYVSGRLKYSLGVQ